MCLWFRKLEIPEAAQALAKERDFELQGYAFDAKQEDTRAPRVIRVQCDSCFLGDHPKPNASTGGG